MFVENEKQEEEEYQSKSDLCKRAVPLHLWTDAQLSHLPPAALKIIKSKQMAGYFSGIFEPNHAYDSLLKKHGDGDGRLLTCFGNDMGVDRPDVLTLGCGCTIYIDGDMYRKLARMIKLADGFKGACAVI